MDTIGSSTSSKPLGQQGQDTADNAANNAQGAIRSTQRAADQALDQSKTSIRSYGGAAVIGVVHRSFATGVWSDAESGPGPDYVPAQGSHRCPDRAEVANLGSCATTWSRSRSLRPARSRWSVRLPALRASMMSCFFLLMALMQA